MAVFRAFKPEAMNKIAKSMGYTGNMAQFQDFIEQDPARQARMEQFKNAAVQMAKGGVVQLANGGDLQKQIADLQKKAASQRYTSYDRINRGGDYKGTVQVDLDKAISNIDRRNLPQLPATMAAYGKTKSELARLQKQYEDMQKQAASQPQTAQPGGGVDGALRFQQVAEPARPVDPRIAQDGPGSRTPFTSQPPAAQPPAGQPTKYMGGFRQPGDAGRYVAFNDPGQPGEGFANAAEYEAAQRGQTTSAAANNTIGETSTQRLFTPGLPQGTVTQTAFTPSEAGQYVPQGTGMVTGAVAVPTAMGMTAQAAPVQEKTSATMEAAQAAPAVDAALQATQAAQGTVDPRAQVTAAQQTASSVGNLTAAQGNAILIDNPVQRNIQAGELISGAANAQTAAQFTEQVEAAQATPSQQATVQGQLAQLTANFDASNPPAWAAGALRNATAQMAARGLGASSLAGQAIVQATIEAALPIAQADAQITAQFETQNLSNRQQRAMLAAQQRATFIGQEFDQAFQARVQNSARIGDIANQNFTAEQQVQLENSRAANTMNLNNLSNRQALVIAEASALANMDLSNLNNRQAAAVQNAQSFLQMDMANLSNQQQTDLFAAQQRIQSLFTDQAAQNAALQFNASSQNQVDQFFSNLASQVSQFNATQSNAQAQFNAGQVNTVERFNAELNNQRDQFNAQNQSVIAQSNAAWRRQLATADTAAVNRANEINAAALLDISNTAYSNLWQYYEDTMEWAWTSAESAEDRAVQMAIAALQADASKDLQKMKNDYQSSAGIGKLIGAFLNSDQGSVGDSIFNSITSWF